METNTPPVRESDSIGQAIRQVESNLFFYATVKVIKDFFTPGCIKPDKANLWTIH